MPGYVVDSRAVTEKLQNLSKHLFLTCESEWTITSCLDPLMSDVTPIQFKWGDFRIGTYGVFGSTAYFRLVATTHKVGAFHPMHDDYDKNLGARMRRV